MADAAQVQAPVAPKSSAGSKKFIFDVGITGGAQFLVFLAAILNVSIVGRAMGATALAEFLLVKRVSSWLTAAITLGISVGIPRFVAQNSHIKGVPEKYFRAGLIIASASAALTWTFCSLGRPFVARWFFGGIQYANLVTPLMILSTATMMHLVIYGYYRGLLLMRTANVLQALNIAVLPLALTYAFAFTKSIPVVLGATAVSILLVCVFSGAKVLSKGMDHVQLPFAAAGKNLLVYSAARMPGDLGIQGLLALGPMIAAHYTDMHQVSFVLLGMSLLMAVGLAITPLGLVLLSKISSMLGQGREKEARDQVNLLREALLHTSSLVLAQSVVFCPLLVQWWVGKSSEGSGPVLRAMVLAVPFYVIYVSCRAVVDAKSTIPYNTRNIFIAFGFFLVLVWFARLAPSSQVALAIGASITAAIAALGTMTWLTMAKLYKLPLFAWKDFAIFGLSGLLGVASFAVQSAAHSVNPALVFVGVNLAAVALFVVGLKAFKIEWWSTMSSIVKGMV